MFNISKKISIVFCLIMLVSCGGGGGSSGGTSSSSSITTTLDYQDSPFGIWDTISGYGINEPDFASMSDIGVHWEAVPVPPLFPATWEDWELTYNKYKNTGIQPVPMINLVSQRGGGGLTMSPTSYYNAIKDAVSYFTGIDYWMLGVEMDNQYNIGAITPQQYALYIRLTYKALKDTRSTAKLVTAGTGGDAYTYTGNGFFVLVFDELENLESIENNHSLYDWSTNPYNLTQADFDLVFEADAYTKYMDTHHFSDFDYDVSSKNYYNSTQNLATAIKSLLNAYGYISVALWDTQTGTHSGQPTTPLLPYQTEEQQANGLIKKYVISLLSGVDKIFWTTSYEFLWGNNSEHFFSKVGIIYNGQGNDDLGIGVKKLSYYTYKKMVEVLEGSDWNNIQTIQESDGVYIYKFIKNNKPIWVTWNDNSTEQQITISGIDSIQVKITNAVPIFDSGQYVTDYNTAFNTEAKTVSNGQVTITLGENPVFVEPLQ